jgi:exopolyphosphatase/guanosine-5'-triphosphate,3'-diphosphate pyrophosphatase
MSTLPPVPDQVPPPAAAAATRGRTLAVIDVGSSSLRLEIAEVGTEGQLRTLDQLQKPVQLGKDTFTHGRISQESIEACVEILKGFRRVMEEYGVTTPAQIRAVATSSVREAGNRDTFLDRIYMATRINVEAIEEAEETRLTYLAVQGIVKQEPDLQKGDALIIEVGGGDTEVLLVQDGHVTYSNTFRLGTLRMRETLDHHRAPEKKVPGILAQHIQLSVEQMRRSVPVSRAPRLVAVSGDARFAASHLSPKWKEQFLARLEIKPFASFAKKIAPLSSDELVKTYRVSYGEAATLGPALMAYAQLAKVFEVETILVPKTSLRQGLLHELAAGGEWTREFTEQVVYSAIALGTKYAFDARHARQVSDLSVRLFRELQPEHQLGPRFELILQVAALLHEIGSFVSNRSHHKHSMYLILNSELFGLSRHHTTLIALVARYHRRAAPQPYHEVFSTLDRDDRLAVAKMAAILRIADALDRNHMQQARELTFARERGRFLITVGDMEDLTLERMALKDKGGMFEDVYGLEVVLRGDAATGGADA